MSHKRQIYLLDPQKLPPETIAVTFAKTSRSPDSFQQIAAELSEAKSAEFNEKWVVGYGHSSVAEHAVLHIAVENISRLAVETLESNRLASYTEKSTRYQTWESDAYHIPAELDNHPLKARYLHTCTDLFETYKACIQPVTSHMDRTCPHIETETLTQRSRRLRTHAIDVCRYLLPASALANVGMTINARALEHAIGKMLISPLQEVRETGYQIKDAALQSIPTLLKYASEIPYLRDVYNDFASINTTFNEIETDWCSLEHFESDTIDRLLAASLYREKNIAYAQALQWVKTCSISKKNDLLYFISGDLDAHTIPVRELENANFTFDLIMDQGAYFEVKRHRMMMQTPQPLTTHLGFATPLAIREAGVLDAYVDAMKKAAETYIDLEAVNPALASYVVPNAYNRRLLITTNLRSLFHFIRLRSASNAHFAVRRVAQRIAEEITKGLPELAPYLGRNKAETSMDIEQAFFLNTGIRGKQ